MFTQALRTRPTLYLLGVVLAFSAISSQAAQETAVSPTLGLERPTALVPAASGALDTDDGVAVPGLPSKPYIG